MTTIFAALFPMWSASRRRREVEEALPLQPGYGQENRLQRNRKKLAGLLFFLTLLYVLAFEIIGRFIPVYFMIPIGVLALLVIWSLPELGRAPTRLLTGLFYAYLVAQFVWPDYLAIALPGLPWITMLRLTCLPMMLILLIALSVSADFRSAIKAVIAPVRPIVVMLAIYAVLVIVSIFVSDAPFYSFNRAINAMVGWVGVFFVACFVFSREGNARRVAGLIWAATLFWLVMAAWEWRLEYVPWRDHVPSIFKIEEAMVDRVLAGEEGFKARGYRLQGKFFTPITFAEFLALAGPFVIHWAMVAKRLRMRFLAVLTLPLMFLVLRGTDSRLGMAGLFMSVMVYALFWAVWRWRYIRDSLFGPAITIGYPVLFAAFLALTFISGRLRQMVWGGGQHQASNDARAEQIDMAIPLIKAQPWGYGIDNGGAVLGFTTPGGLLTIDSYYLSLLLDLGILGFLVYMGMFLGGIYIGARRAIDSAPGETLWIAPATISLVNFVIIKSVLSQAENHSLAFALLAMVVALAWRIRQANAEMRPSTTLAVSRPQHGRIGMAHG